MSIVKSLTLIFSVFLCFQVSAQSSKRFKEGQLIVRLKKGAPLKFLSSFSSKGRTLVKGLNLHVVKLKGNLKSADVIERLKRSKYVLYAQRDHYVKRRGINRDAPNDDMFNKQWSLNNEFDNNSDVKALEAWDLVYKNPVPAGQEPVLAVVDGGVDFKHEDLKENMWVNKGEIPGNNKDDDGNGYVDDIYGWNAALKNGNIIAETHGTHVGGILGARGNNKTGITGVNPRIKVMSVIYSGGGDSLTSRVLAGYSYILEQKKLWLETKGKKGANVVATNSSFGVDGANCESDEYVAWNDMYDQMGKVGILSAAATANRNWNIDEVGDVPTGCSSKFLITVTNSNDKAEKNSGAGYGIKTIDLAAPGTNILSTTPGDNYRELTGTSMATPHVAGAVGLLHMIKKGQRFARQEPGKYALYLKNVLMNTVSKNENFDGKVVAGGILNLEKAAKKVISRPLL